MAAHGFPAGTQAEQVLPNFASTASANATQALAFFGGLEAEGKSLGVTDRGALVTALAERLAAGECLIVESVNRTGRGHRLPVELSLQLLPSVGDGPLILGVVHDLSHRKQDLTAVQSAGSGLRAILESAPVAIVTLTLEGFVASWNHGAERIYGWAARETLLQPPPFTAEPVFLKLVGQVLDRRVTRTLVTERRCKHGTCVKLNLSISPLFNDAGQLIGLLEVAEDITDRTRVELLETNRRLLEGREAERLRLARELHDGALQDLIGIGFTLAQLRDQLKNSLPTGQAERLHETQTEVLRVARLLRGVVSDLRPAGLEDFGRSATP